uniref:Uncharacterized protein n=1 Tax=Ciona intestinalis TaxID=7719 RepID=H2Y191_CIOIN
MSVFRITKQIRWKIFPDSQHCFTELCEERLVHECELGIEESFLTGEDSFFDKEMAVTDSGGLVRNLTNTQCC